jgi:hypothetical protein
MPTVPSKSERRSPANPACMWAVSFEVIMILSYCGALIRASALSIGQVDSYRSESRSDGDMMATPLASATPRLIAAPLATSSPNSL